MAPKVKGRLCIPGDGSVIPQDQREKRIISFSKLFSLTSTIEYTHTHTGVYTVYTHVCGIIIEYFKLCLKGIGNMQVVIF